jgi:hypothetical protein
MTDREAIALIHESSASFDEEVARLRLQLRQESLDKLVEQGLVDWDRENNVVRKGPNFDRGRPLKR